MFLGAVLAIGFFLLTQPSFAADDECSSDTGIPYGVIAPIDVGRLRKTLAESGVSVGGFYLGETFANIGGMRNGETYDGVVWTYLLADLHKAGLWKGLCFYTDFYQIHGRSITADNIGSLATVSNYEAMPSTSLSELWLEQHLFNDHLTVRVGQLTADTEFLLSSGGSNFLDSTWGWATLPSFDLPGGGPSYPHATPGVRVALKPNDRWNLMLGLYNSDPELDSPLLLMAEGRYNYNQGGRLPGTVKIGGWNQFGTLHDQLLASTSPTVAMTSNSVMINSDWAIYGIVDQRVWRVPDSKDASGISLFGRAEPSGKGTVENAAVWGVRTTINF